MEITDEDGTVYRQGAGNYGRDEFELNGDGESYSYIALVPNPNEAEYLFYDTNADGEHYAYDTTLTDALMLGTVSDIQSDGDTVSFRYQYDYDEEGDSATTWVVGREDALIRSVDFGNMSMTETMRPGADVPFQKELEDAFRRSGGFLGQAMRAMESDDLLPQAAAFAESYAAGDAFGVLQALVPLEKTKREQLIRILGQIRQWIVRSLEARSTPSARTPETDRLLAVRTGSELFAAAAALQTAIEDLELNASTGAVIGWLTAKLR